MNQCMTLNKRGQPMVLLTREIPEPPPRGLILKVHYAGVCHTDVHLWKDQSTNSRRSLVVWGPPDKPHHRVVGHEISGEVYTMGTEEIEGEVVLKVGDRVVTCAQQGCVDKCKFCQKGATINCTNWSDHSLGFGYDGGFQKYVTIYDRTRLVKLPASVSMDTAAILPCSALTSYNAVMSIKPHAERLMEYYDSLNVLLVGAGGLGLWGVQFAKALLPQCCRLVVADLSEERLDEARKYGADDVINWSGEDDDVTRRTQALFDDGVNLVIDYVNIPSSIKRATNLLVTGGCVVLVGALQPKAETSFNFSTFISKTMNFTGIKAGTVQQLHQVVSMVASGKVRPIPITHTKLPDLCKTFQAVERGEYLGRAVVKH